MREVATVLGLPDKPIEVDVPKGLHITTMSRYNAEFPFPIAFPPQPMTNVLVEWLAKQRVKQVHIAETAKYTHVTFFFIGGIEKQFEDEERHMIPSPSVATYNKYPKMSVQAVADKVAEVMLTKTHEFVMCNFAPPDMVGHAGVYDAAVEAITHTDAAGYILLVTADHGNAEQMLNSETGAPHTAHTTNAVPFIMTGDPGKYKFVEDKTSGGEEAGKDAEEEGALADVAPTILVLMSLPQPEEMTGQSLLATTD